MLETSIIEEAERHLNEVYDKFASQKMIKDIRLGYDLAKKKEQIKVIEFIDKGETIRSVPFKKAERIEVTQIAI